MRPIELTNTAVLDALGIPWKDQHIASATIRLQHDRLPVVEIQRYLDEVCTGAVEGKRFTLTVIDDLPATPPPLDIAAMATAAQERLARYINRRTEEHMAAMRLGYVFPWMYCLSNESGEPLHWPRRRVPLELKGLL